MLIVLVVLEEDGFLDGFKDAEWTLGTQIEVSDRDNWIEDKDMVYHLLVSTYYMLYVALYFLTLCTRGRYDDYSL